MAELRRDPIIGQWVVVAADDESVGPDSYDKVDQTRTQQAVCQFCEGREEQTPPEVECLRGEGSEANTPGWSVRVIPNRFPALRIEGDLDKRGIGLYDVSNGIGAHEILVETKDHDRDLADLSVEEITDVIRLYQNRLLNLAKDKRFKYIMIFKNYGKSAGASVEHAHSQIIALPMVPHSVQAELDGSHNYFSFRGRCVYCDIIQQEVTDKKRIVIANDTFMAFCPFVVRYPFECWILPKEHEPNFCSLGDETRRQLAMVLKEMLVRMQACLAQCSYNFYLHTMPVHYKEPENFHWHIEIVPQITREEGYEWATGLHTVRTSPAAAAGFLRDVKI